MSNWENHIVIWIYDQLDRLFDIPPKWILGYTFYAIDVSGLEDHCDEPFDEVQKIYVDECSFVISHDDIGHWGLNEDIITDIQIWGKNGNIFIQFDDENEWWGLKIIRNSCPELKESKRSKRVRKHKAMLDLYAEKYSELLNPKTASWDSKNDFIAIQ